jgi:hypothetical protein
MFTREIRRLVAIIVFLLLLVPRIHPPAQDAGHAGPEGGAGIEASADSATGWIDDQTATTLDAKPHAALRLPDGSFYPPADRWEELDRWLVVLRAYFATGDHHRLRSPWLQYGDAYVEFDLFAWRERASEATDALMNGWPEGDPTGLGAWLDSFGQAARLMYGGNARPIQPPDEPHYDLPAAEGFTAPSAERLDAMAIMAAVGARQREARREFHPAAICYNTALLFAVRLWQPWMPLRHTVDTYNRLEILLLAIDDSLTDTPYPPQAAASLLNAINMIEAELPDAKAAIESDLLNFWQVVETAPEEQLLCHGIGMTVDMEFLVAAGMDIAADPEHRDQFLAARPFVEDGFMRLVMGDELTWEDVSAMPFHARGALRDAVTAIRGERHIRERIDSLRVKLIERQDAATE